MSNVVIRDCKLRGNGSYIQVSDSSEVTIFNNQILFGEGVKLGVSQNIVVENNLIALDIAETSRGIAIHGGTLQNSKIVGNYISVPKQRGIVLDGMWWGPLGGVYHYSIDVIVKDNTFADAQIGIHDVDRATADADLERTNQFFGKDRVVEKVVKKGN